MTETEGDIISIMDAKELIMANRLSDARTLLATEVKGAPADARSRTLLFQVLSFFGEWDKAERHLDILAMGDPLAETWVRVFKDLVRAERARDKVAYGEERPDFLTSVPPYLDLNFSAREKLRAGCVDEAFELFREASARTPDVSGAMDGREFNAFRNVDSLHSSFLEVFIHDRYLWIPFESLRELTVREPKTLLDFLWIQATLTTWEGLTTGCYLPVTYPLSSAHLDDLVRLGRVTVWEEPGGKLIKGSGQHVFAVGEEEKGILELREVRFATAGREVKDASRN